MSAVSSSKASAENASGAELTTVLEERTPTYIADWSVKDRPRARELLESLRGKK